MELKRVCLKYLVLQLSPFCKDDADKYINQISDIFRILGENSIGTQRPGLGKYIDALPFERHIIYFLQSDSDIIIHILSLHRDAERHLSWKSPVQRTLCVKSGRINEVHTGRFFTEYLFSFLLFSLRFCLSWHYSIPLKFDKSPHSPCYFFADTVLD